MKSPAVHVKLAFDFQLSIPQEMSELPAEALQQSLTKALGAMVLQGLPTIAAKQLAASGVSIERHSHTITLDVEAAPAALERETLLRAAPHLTDDELRRLAGRLQGPLPDKPDERNKLVRRQALAFANEFRLVSGTVHAVLTSEQPGALEATLNLTNGSVMIEPHDRQKRLLPGQPEVVFAPRGADVKLKAAYAGHTISGPVIEMSIDEIASQRDVLIGLWQQAG